MSGLNRWLAAFLFRPDSSIWLAVLRIGFGLQVLFYGISLRPDWLTLFARENQGLIRRDLTEAMLSVDSPLIPRVGWIVDAGAVVGLSESSALWLVWGVLMLAALLLVAGLFSRSASVVTWILYVATAKTAEVWSYGLDNFTIIGLFYLAIAPLPDSFRKPRRSKRAMTFLPFGMLLLFLVVTVLIRRRSGASNRGGKQASSPACSGGTADQLWIFLTSPWAHFTASSAGVPWTAFAYISVMMYLLSTSAALRSAGPA